MVQPAITPAVGARHQVAPLGDEHVGEERQPRLELRPSGPRAGRTACGVDARALDEPGPGAGGDHDRVGAQALAVAGPRRRRGRSRSRTPRT